MHHAASGEVNGPMPQTQAVAELAQPSSTPDPITEQRIEDCPTEQAPVQERAEPPALGHRAGRDRRSGVHERHHVEEEGEHGDVIRLSRQRPAASCKNPSEVAELYQPVPYRLVVADQGKAISTEHQRIADEEERYESNAEDSEVGHDDMSRMLGTAETRLYQ